MSGQDPLNDIRDILGNPEADADLSPKNFSDRTLIGSHATFKTERIDVCVLGNNGRLEAILIEAVDLRNDPPSVDREFIIKQDEAPGTLRALMQAEVQESALSSTPEEDRPEFPITVAEVPGSDGSAVRISLGLHNGYINVKMSRFRRGRAFVRDGRWAKFSGPDIRPIARLLLAALDAITDTPDAGPTETSAQDDIGF